MTRRFLTPLSTNHVDFNLDNPSTSAEGRLRWDSSEGTLNLGLSSSKEISMGEDAVYRVRNSTGSVLNKGTAVYASGVEPSGRIRVSPYLADGSVREIRFMGLVSENINNGVNGFVQHFGYVKNLDTRGTAETAISVGDETWAAGDILYVHPTVPGKLTNVKPQHEIIVAILIIRHQSSGVLFVRPSSSGHLEDIHDIEISSPQDGDILSYNSSSGLWENNQPAATETVVSSGSAYPTISLTNGQLFYNTSNGRTGIYFDSIWKEFAYATEISGLDGGLYSTTVFDNSIDGGSPGDLVFVGNYDGGEL